ncbi:crotonase/enoyl-CoA hydratase family protein [Sphingomonas sp.]|uniref:crotonase/enoyl-CoA hydratase family protein n=1 Tax=Sphingomonas sp. TaxID=28214 RepID=UPI002CD84B86|nr:crotonase/enoyl-CoA hydratase family protein [Sphingomonas sp.]HWK35436.1 crotonase/enoyl-CoA hydratase family protein [Sphingomonas sp.]
MTQPVLVERTAAIVRITLNLPERRNPISGLAVQDALLAALAQADRDPDVGAIVLTGAGSAFSTGGDITDMAPGGALVGDDPTVTRRNYRNGIQRLPLAFDALEVPVIAAVNGPAIGAGCDLACMADIRIASSAARFAESFARLGLIAGDGGAWLLPQVIGYSRAAEMAFTGDMIDATRALDIGLVAQVVEPAALMPAAMELAQRIAANPGYAVRSTKRLMKEARLATLAGILDMSAALQAIAHTTDDHRRAVQAFNDRRR